MVMEMSLGEGRNYVRSMASRRAGWPHLSHRGATSAEIASPCNSVASALKNSAAHPKEREGEALMKPVIIPCAALAGVRKAH